MDNTDEVIVRDGAIDNANGEVDEDPNALFSPNSAENMPTKEDRVFRKAKRPVKVSKSEDGAGNGEASAGSPPVVGSRSKSGILPYTKNSRKSRRNTHGRGQAKKGENH